MLRVVLFTNKSRVGVEILKQMKSKHIPIEAIFIDIEKRPRAGRLRKVKRDIRRIGLIETTRLILIRVQEELWKTRKQGYSNDFYRSYSDKVYIVKNFNGEQCEQLLNEIEPDIVILGGSRIIRKNIIRIPKIGILNTHPGLLPKYRGVDPIPWAIHHGDPVGVTLHFIDAGIDTGDIVAQKIIDVTEDDTLDSLYKKAFSIAGELVSEAILKLIETGHIRRTPQVKGHGEQFYRIPLSLRQEIERKLN